MPDENVVTNGGSQTSNQTSVTTQNQTSTTSNQTNNDFVLDFGDGGASDTGATEPNIPSQDNDLLPDEEDVKNSGGDTTISGLSENDDDTLNGDDLFSNEDEDTENTDNTEDTNDTNNTDDLESTDNTTKSDSYDDFDISFDTQTDDNSVDGDSIDLAESNEETDETSSTDMQSDSDFNLDLDSPEGSGEDETNSSDEEIQDEEIQDEETQDEEIQDEETQDEEIQDEEIQDEEIHDEEIQDEEIQDEEIQDEEIHDEEIQSEEIHDENNDNLESKLRDETMDPTENMNSESIDSEDSEIEPTNIDLTGNETENVDTNETANYFLNDTNETVEENGGDMNLNKDSENSLNDEPTQDSTNEGINDNNQENELQTNNSDSTLETNSQALNFDPFKVINQTEAPTEMQPNIQDYENIEQADDLTTKPEGETSQEPNKPVDMIDFDNNSSNETNNSGIVLDYPGDKSESQNIYLDNATVINQENTLNQENTESGNWSSLNSEEINTNSPADIQTGPIQNLPQENELNTTLPIESEATTSEVNDTASIQESSEIEANSTQGEEKSDNTPETNQMQATLSLDQILDSELLSNPKYANNSVAVPENTVSKPPRQSNKVGAIFLGGILVVAGVVALLAFPMGNSNRKPGDIIDTGNIVNSGHGVSSEPEVNFPEPDYIEPDSTDNTDTGNEENNVDNGLDIAPSNVEFPDPYGGIDDNERNDGLDEDPKPVPYVGNMDDIIDEEPEEIEEISVEDILSSISSFKSQAETYYSYGQEMLDKKVIKYASQMINACDTYQEQVSAGEGINQSTLSQFEDNMFEIISKIEEHNNGGSESPQIIQNNVETNENDYDFSEKEELKDYIYSR